MNGDETPEEKHAQDLRFKFQTLHEIVAAARARPWSEYLGLSAWRHRDRNHLEAQP